jgi:selenocysteine lyase/cysteine desulfurase
MLGSFSACSNVTGIAVDTREVARLLHQHGAFACFDFAARYTWHMHTDTANNHTARCIT